MTKLYSLLCVLIILIGCSKEEDPIADNPFLNPALFPPPDTGQVLVFEEGSFQYIYHNIFSPTCANSGCHDGNFEPDFRTIYSSYNTLVKHQIIKNNSTNDFLYRVDPGNLATSVLVERLTNDIDGISGIMPLALEPNSDWPDKKDTYIQMIKDWILDGAPDTYGNTPTDGNLKPQVIGIMAFHSGSTTNPLSRLNGANSPIGIPNTSIDVWMAFDDDNTPVSNFKLTLLKSSRELFDFSNAEEFSMQSSTPISGTDFWNNTVSFTHKATLSYPTDSVGTEIFLRAYLRDDIQEDTTEMPNHGTNEIIRSYFTLKVDSL